MTRPTNFEPLSEPEKVSGFDKVSTPHAREEDGELVSPIPADAPNAPKTHARFGPSTAAWTYRDARGAPLFQVFRFDSPGERKQFLPLSLWREAPGLRWRWKAVPAPRPLYGLDRLAALPDVPVIVCEGEKAADAAALVFPRSVVVTSPSGARAAGQCDWTPLAGRRVLIWPDADESGAKYALEVARILHGLQCEVSTIDAAALASMAPDGGEREPTKGYDAANAIAEWRDISTLRKVAHGLAKAFDAGPAFISWGAFTMNAQGLTQETTKGRGEKAETVTEWISAPFEILGACRDPNGRAWGKFIRWRDADGRAHVRHVTDAALQGEAGPLSAMLASDGLAINRNQQRAFATYLSGATVKSRVTVVSRTGWHSIGGHAVFVLAEETIGPRGAERVILDAAALGPYEARGSLEDWKEGVGALARGHALPILAISAALAGPLLHLAGQEGGGLNIFGGSSKGRPRSCKPLVRFGAGAVRPAMSARGARPRTDWRAPPRRRATRR